MPSKHARFLCAVVLMPALVGGVMSEVRASPSAAAEAGVRADSGAPIRLAQLFGQRRDEERMSELVARLGQLENQIRQLTGMIEELQHRNQQLEQQLRRVQQDTEFRFQELGSSGRSPAARSETGSVPPPALPPVAARPGPGAGAPPDLAPPATATRRRGDAFDPSAMPDAPGAPRTLGTLSVGGGAAVGSPTDPAAGDPVLRPPGTLPSGTLAGPPVAPAASDPALRVPGAPLDLGALVGSGGPDPVPSDRIGDVPGPLPGASPVGPQAVLAPSGSARDEFDLAYGAILRRDYELAEQAFRTFLANHAADRHPEAQRLVPDAYYWLGESQFQRKQYNDAAETFLDIYNKFPNSLKAPDALLRLGQSLAALGKQDAACASLGAVLSKYPKASANVRRAVEQEQKRARC